METRERIKMVREEQGLSRVEFAHRIGRTPSFLTQLENGTSGFSEQTVLSICRVFGVRYEWLLSGQGSMYEDGREDLGRVKTERDEDGVPSRVKAVRGKMKMTQQQFADYLKCSKVQIAKVESGKGKASDRWLEHVAEKCTVNLTWLRSGNGEMDEMKNDGEINQMIEYLKFSEKAQTVMRNIMHEDDSIWYEIERTLQERRK